MDKEAVNSSSHDMLRELSLLTRGDLLDLRAFCLKIEIANETSGKNENRLWELKYAIGNNGHVSKVGATKFPNNFINWSNQEMEVVQDLLKITRMLLKKSF